MGECNRRVTKRGVGGSGLEEVGVERESHDINNEGFGRLEVKERRLG